MMKEKMTENTSDQTFYALPIRPRLLARIAALGYSTPTGIQAAAIPPAIEGRDLVGIAQTGTGKTLAFIVPMIQRIAETKGRGLVLAPTRELALQIAAVAEAIGKEIGLRSATVIGGAPIQQQIRMLKRDPHIIIATPGRVIDLLDRKSLSLDAIRMLVLDEADLMFDMGFAPQIGRILKDVPRERQTLLFSATMPEPIAKIVAGYMKDPIRIDIARAGSAPARIAQEMRLAQKGEKQACLDALLKERAGSAIVFVRTKFGARKLSRALRESGHAAAEIHSDRSLAQRRAALDGFKAGKQRVLVATDIAARGIDVSGVALVVNYDLPENPEDYVHRIGRTGRAGRAGCAVSFVQPDQRQLCRRIERLVGAAFPNIEDQRTPNSAPRNAFRHAPRNAGRQGGGMGRSKKPIRMTFVTKKRYARNAH